MPGTPTLEFTGTDVNADSVRYQVHIDTVNTFDSQAGVGTFDLKHVDIGMRKTGSPTDNLTLEVLSGSMTGTVLGTSNTVAASSLTTSETFPRFTFSTPVTLSFNTKYYLRLTRSGARDATNYTYVSVSGNSDSGGGTFERNNNTWSSESATVDWRFIVYDPTGVAVLTQLGASADIHAVVGGTGTSAETSQSQGQSFTLPLSGPLLNKISGTDSGFVNTVTGGDTDPFNSGEKASFTVQAGDALAPGTYYWRVRGIDPSGSNSYGAWAATRSFTITAAAGFPPFPRPLPMPMAPILAQ